VGDISGADFTGAKLDGASFSESTHDPSNPPKGLPPELAASSGTDVQFTTPDGRRLIATVEPTDYQETPIPCHATINVVPIGD
jgi:hypothetical protein